MTSLQHLNAALTSLESAKTHLRLADERGDKEQVKIAKVDISNAIKHAAEAMRGIR